MDEAAISGEPLSPHHVDEVAPPVVTKMPVMISKMHRKRVLEHVPTVRNVSPHSEDENARENRHRHNSSGSGSGSGSSRRLSRLQKSVVSPGGANPPSSGSSSLTSFGPPSGGFGGNKMSSKVKPPKDPVLSSDSDEGESGLPAPPTFGSARSFQSPKKNAPLKSYPQTISASKPKSVLPRSNRAMTAAVDALGNNKHSGRRKEPKLVKPRKESDNDSLSEDEPPETPTKKAKLTPSRLTIPERPTTKSPRNMNMSKVKESSSVKNSTSGRAKSNNGDFAVNNVTKSDARLKTAVINSDVTHKSYSNGDQKPLQLLQPKNNSKEKSEKKQRKSKRSSKENKGENKVAPIVPETLVDHSSRLLEPPPFLGGSFLGITP